MNKIDLKNLDKSNWKSYRFDEIAKNISERVDPTNTDLELYIGLEHLDPETIHIKRSGTKDDVKGQKLKCYPGDVIFGKRRAYQRKASLVRAVGLCSAHAFVLRANSEVIDPQLFPFFLHSDVFMHRAVDISVGGLSPTINWGILKAQEFILPPKEQQAGFITLLCAQDDVIETNWRLLSTVFSYLKVKQEEIISSNVSDWKRLDAIVLKKISYGIVQAGVHVNNGMPYIKSSDLSKNGINKHKLKKTSFEIAKKYQRSEVGSGDIVFSLRGNLGAMNIVPQELKVANLTQGTARISLSKGYYNKYVKYALETMKVQRRIRALSKGSTFKEISLESLRTVKVPIPKSEVIQIEIAKTISLVKKTEKLIKSNLSNSKSLQKSLINQIF